MRPYRAHSLSPCIQFGPVVGLLESAWKRKCALFLCTRGGLRDFIHGRGTKSSEPQFPGLGLRNATNGRGGSTGRAAVPGDRLVMAKKKKTYTAVSLFCGAGGLDLGFHNAGFRTVWANDFNADACATFSSWSSAQVVCGDISKIDSDSIPDSDIILGGFPCQGFSLSGPRRIDDSRNVLYKEYVRILKSKMPLAFVGENVKGLLTMGDGKIAEAIFAAFHECGYDVRCRLLNAADYGVPQDRERVIIVGLREDLRCGAFDFPAPDGKRVSLRDAIGNMPRAEDSDVCDAPFSPRYMSRNRKRGWDDVSFTIPAMAKQVTLHPSSPDMVKLGKDNWTFGKRGATRRLSWREAAAIQTFPAGLEFSGDITSKYKQIGNAVPVRLAEKIGRSLLSALNGGR